MAIFKTFHQRQKELRGEVSDVFSYNALPPELIIQLVHVFRETIGSKEEYDKDYCMVRPTYRRMVNLLRKELAVFTLPHRTSFLENPFDEFYEFLLKEPNVDLKLTAVELGCRVIDNMVSEFDYRNDMESAAFAAAAIDEVNARFRMHGVGYEYRGEIVRIDSEFIHAEAVKPVLSLLRGEQFAGAEDEFRKAFEHYRKGHLKEALAEAAKSLESTMKTICTIRGWAFAPNDTAKNLIDICIREGLIPQYWLSHFNGLRSTLEGGVPTARNRTSGHGQGAAVQSVPDYLVSYVLHLTASTILFLVNAEKHLGPT